MIGLLIATATVADVATATAAAPLVVAPVVVEERRDGWAFGGYLRAGGVVPQDDAFMALSSNGALVRGEVGGVWAFDPRWSLELGLAYGRTSASTLGLVQTSLEVTSIQAAALYRQPIFGDLAAHGRALLSADFGRFRADDAETTTDLEETAFALGGALTAGLSMSFPTTDVGALMIFAEGGYQLHTGFAFGAVSRDATGAPDPARIERTSVDAGGVGLSGPAWRAGASVVF